jgi:hypothetical protein
MAVDWDKYRALQAQGAALNRIGPVTVEYTWDEYLEIKHALMLLRRVRDNTRDGDLDVVERHLTALVGARINEKFRSRDGAAEIREEAMRVLKEGRDE